MPRGTQLVNGGARTQPRWFNTKPSALPPHHSASAEHQEHLLVPGIIPDTKDTVENKIQTASAKRFHSYGRDGA